MLDPFRPLRSPRARGLFNGMAWTVHGLVLAAAVVVVGRAASPLFHQPPRPATQPSNMETVNWTSPNSSTYCLACHKEVAQATAGRDVEQGHSHNVPLNRRQLQAVREMGTVTGPDGVLICMSCHKLGSDDPHMLGETLAGSRLCQGCHPEQFNTVGSPHDLRITAPDEMNRFGQTAESGGPCSACHLSHHYAREFEPCELDPDGRCITCHQIGRAAARLARPTMEHPDSHCVVCHNPHDKTNGHFLKKPAAEMCNDCHGEYAGGPGQGMHPLGEMPYPIPQVLVDAGAQTFGNSRQLTCMVCHSTHSSVHAPLLTLSPDSNELCLACHENELAEKSPDGRMPVHGTGPRLTPEQRAVAEGRGGRVGPNGELLCISCHKVHHAEPNAMLLSFRPGAEHGCSDCHLRQAGVIGTMHDLRISAPAEQNLAGLTPRTGGPCSPCHMAHQTARTPAPTDADVSGACTSCHQETGCARAELDGNVGHPGANCMACHDPHDQATGQFLTKDAAGLCKSCHVRQYQLVGGPHDPQVAPASWPDEAESGKGACLTCHITHGQKGSALLRLGNHARDNHDSACLTCHPKTAWRADSGVAAIHPQKISPDQKKVPLALVPTDQHGGLRMGCRTCHDPHGGPQPAHLARVEPGEPTATLCTHCHADKKLIEMTGHATDRLAGLGFDTDSCKPCHAMHATPDGAWGQMLSPRFLHTATQPADFAGKYSHEAAVPCLVCHHAGGPAPVRNIATHPPVTMVNIVKPEDPGYMPLFGADGKVSENGQITCRTCHLSHGQTELLRAAAQRDRILSPEEQHSARMQLRPFVAPNLCTQCHGTQGRLKFLFFHNLEQRG